VTIWIISLFQDGRHQMSENYWYITILWDINLKTSFIEFWYCSLHQTEAIENCYSMWKHSAKNGKLLAIIFVVFINISLLAKVLKLLHQITFFNSFSFIYSTTFSVNTLQRFMTLRSQAISYFYKLRTFVRRMWTTYC
jgi:hypothetical protein